MRLGFIGPADTDSTALEAAAKLLIIEYEVDQVVYLGEDQALQDFVATHGPSGDGEEDAALLEQRVARVAATGSPTDIGDLVRRLRSERYLEKLRVAPSPPTRLMEMLDDRIVLIVRLKASIGEEDVVNSNVVIYGDAREPLFKRFGPRCFFSPGPLQGGLLGILDDESEAGGVELKAVDVDGKVIWTEPIQGRGAKVMVAP